MSTAIATVESLSVSYGDPRTGGVGKGRALDDVSLQLHERQALAVVGESGSGKTTLALTVAGVLRRPPAVVEGAAVRMGGQDLLTLLVLDEAVSALDSSVQAQVLNLLTDLQQRFGLSYLFIAHDLGLVRQVSTKIIVLYLGLVMELGPAESLFSAPMHPYTDALVRAALDLDQLDDGIPEPLGGEIPSSTTPPSGCPFRTRCPSADALCAERRPPLTDTGYGRQVACHHPLPVSDGRVMPLSC